MAGVTLQLKGFDKLERKLGPLRAGKYWAGILKAAALDVKNYIAEYPPASEANNPQGRTWYERGFGPRWYRADGSIGGSRTSETLGRRWTISADSQRAVIGNNASYAPFVQSAEQQSPWHKRRGWRTDQETIDKLKDKIMAKVKRAIEDILSR